jgi:hypothetical protein
MLQPLERALLGCIPQRLHLVELRFALRVARDLKRSAFRLQHRLRRVARRQFNIHPLIRA